MANILTGRKKVIIPISADEFYKDVVGMLKKHLSTAIQTHNENVRDIEKLEKQYLGNQDILTEKQRYDDSPINNLVVENHVHKVVNFKVGFMYGNPIEYSITNSKNTDDMSYLNAYFLDSNKASLDIEKAKDIYKYGVAYQLVLPKKSTEIEDIHSEAPFVLQNLPVEKTCMVYSNDIPNQKLFALVVSSKNNSNGIPREYYNVFLPNRKIELDFNRNVVKDIPQIHKSIPIVEYCCNSERMGIIELIYLLQHTVNHLNSSELDEIEEIINSFMIIKNQKIDDEDEFIKTWNKLKKHRLVVLNTGNPETPADIEMLNSKLDLESVNQYYERIKKAMYDISGTPQSSGNVTSGGDTGQARLLGNGWESAQNQAQVDTTYLIQFERELVRKIIAICIKTPSCPLDKIKASDVSIKFNINMSNNLLVKSQALMNLRTINYPVKQALNAVGLTNDVDGVGNEWQKEIETSQEQSQQQEQKNDVNAQ